MPLVRISLVEGKPESLIAKTGNAIHRGMVETINVPAQDRLQIITEHTKSHFIYDPDYLGVHRSDGLIVIQITLNQGRPVEMKKALYKPRSCFTRSSVCAWKTS